MTAPTRGADGFAPPAKRGLSTRAIVGIAGGGLALVLVVVAVVVFLGSGRDTITLTAAGADMEPTIRPGQSVTATKVDPGEYQPKRGDIVAFSAPDGWLATKGDSKLVKRVIGLPGERVACCDPSGKWTVDGKPLAEPYVKAGSATACGPVEVVVPDGRLWVMGDNRTASNDSCTYYLRTSDIAVATIPVQAVSAVVTP